MVSLRKLRGVKMLLYLVRLSGKHFVTISVLELMAKLAIVSICIGPKVDSVT